MDAQEKILQIRVNTDDAVKTMADLNKELQSLRDHEKELQKEIKELSKDEKANADVLSEKRQELVATKEAEKDYSNQISQVSRSIQNKLMIEKNELKVAAEKNGSLKELRAELSRATKEYDNLSRAEREGYEGDEKLQHIVELTDEIKKAEENTKRFYRNVGNYPDVKPLSAQLHEIIQRMQQLKLEGKDNTEEFKNLSQQAGAMKDAISDTSKVVANLGSDTGTLNALQQSITSVTSVMSLLTATLATDSAEGEKNSQIMKTLKTILATLSVATALQTNLQKQSALMLGVQTIQTKAAAAATALQTKNTWLAVAAQKVLNKVASMNPYVLLAAGIASVVGGLILWKSGSKELTHELMNLDTEIESHKRYVSELAAEYDFAIELMQAKGLGEWEIYDKTVEKYKKIAEEYGDEVKKLSQEYKRYENMSLLEWLELSEEEQEYAEDLLDKLLETKRKEYDAIVDVNNAIRQKEIIIAKDQLDTKKRYIEGSKSYNQEYIETIEDTYKKELKTEEARYGQKKLELEREAEIQKAYHGEESKEYKLFCDKIEFLESTHKNNLRNIEKKHRKQIEDELQNAQNAVISLMKEGVEKETALENLNYQKSKAALQEKLDEEERINGKNTELYLAYTTQIEALEQQHQDKLDKISLAGRQKEAEEMVETMQMKLNLIKNNLEAEYDLRQQMLDKQLELELSKTEYTEEQKELIRQKYAQDVIALEEQKRLALEEQTKLEWSNRIEEAKLRMGEYLDNALEAMELEVEQAKEHLDNLHQIEGESDEEFKARMLQAQSDYLKKKKQMADAEIAIEKAKATAYAEFAGQLSDLLETVGEDNKNALMLSKTLALAEVAIKQGVAIAEAVAASAAGDPYTYAIRVAAAIASTVTAMVKAISSINAAKFGQGGPVKGRSHAQGGVLIEAEGDEFVMNKRAYAMYPDLIESINALGNGIGTPARVFNSNNVVNNYSSQSTLNEIAQNTEKRLVVSVEEIHRVEDNVEAIENLSTM